VRSSAGVVSVGALPREVTASGLDPALHVVDLALPARSLEGLKLFQGVGGGARGAGPRAAWEDSRIYEVEHPLCTSRCGHSRGVAGCNAHNNRSAPPRTLKTRIARAWASSRGVPRLPLALFLDWGIKSSLMRGPQNVETSDFAFGMSKSSICIYNRLTRIKHLKLQRFLDNKRKHRNICCVCSARIQETA
jgi:hypothetical protein